MQKRTHAQTMDLDQQQQQQQRTVESPLKRQKKEASARTLDRVFQWLPEEILEGILCLVPRCCDLWVVKVCRRWRAIVQGMPGYKQEITPVDFATACVEDNCLDLFVRVQNQQDLLELGPVGWQELVQSVVRHGRLSFLQYLYESLCTETHGFVLIDLLRKKEMSIAALWGHPAVLKYIRQHSKSVATRSVVFNATASGSQECVDLLHDVIAANQNHEFWDKRKMLHKALMGDNRSAATRIILSERDIRPLRKTISQLIEYNRAETLVWLCDTDYWQEQREQWALRTKRPVDECPLKNWFSYREYFHKHREEWAAETKRPLDEFPAQKWLCEFDSAMFGLAMKMDAVDVVLAVVKDKICSGDSARDRESLILHAIRTRNARLLRLGFVRRIEFRYSSGFDTAIRFAIRNDELDPAMLEWVFYRVVQHYFDRGRNRFNIERLVHIVKSSPFASKWYNARKTENWKELRKLVEPGLSLLTYCRCYHDRNRKLIDPCYLYLNPRHMKDISNCGCSLLF